MKKIIVVTALLFMAIDVYADSSSSNTENFNRVFDQYQKARDEGNLRQQLRFAKESIDHGKLVFDRTSKSMAVLYYNLAKSQYALGKTNAAIESYERVLAQYESVYGKQSLELVDVLFDYGDARAKPFRQTSQEAMYKRALTIIKQEYGKDSYEYAYANSDAGIRILLLAKGSAAKQYIKKGYKLMRKNFGENSTQIAYPALNMAKLNVYFQKKKKAIKYLDFVVNNLEGKQGTGKQMKMTAHGILATVYTDLKKDDIATEHCLIVSKMRSEIPNQEPYRVVSYPPRFPAISSRWNMPGRVHIALEYDVDEKGFVRDVRVVKRIGPESFVKAAIKALKRSRYAPAFVNGQPQSTKGMKQSYRFNVVNAT